MAGMGEVQQKLDFVIEVFTEGMEKLEAAGDKVEEFSDKVEDSGDNIAGHMDDAEESLQDTSEAADDAKDSFMKMTGQGLALLFAGRFLSQTFGSMARKMRDVFGVSDMLSGAMISVLAPAMSALMPIFTKLTEALVNMDEDTKMVVGAVVMFLAAIAPLISLLGQTVALASAFGVGLGAIASMVGTVLAAFGSFLAAFAVVNAAFKKFGDIAGTVITAVIVIIAALVASTVGLPIAVAAALGAVIAWFWNMKDEIADAISWVIEGIMSLPDTIRDSVSEFADAAEEIGREIINGLLGFMENNKSKVIGFIKSLLTAPLSGMKSLADGAAGAVDSVRGVNDFVMTGDKLLKTHPNDVIFGMKNPGELGSGEGGGDVTINIDKPQLSRDVDIDKLVERLEREIDRKTGGRSGLR